MKLALRYVSSNKYLPWVNGSHAPRTSLEILVVARLPGRERQWQKKRSIQWEILRPDIDFPDHDDCDDQRVSLQLAHFPERIGRCFCFSVNRPAAESLEVLPPRILCMC